MPSLSPCLAFASLHPLQPWDCPCFTALCRIHTQESNGPRHWPGASRRTPHTSGAGPLPNGRFWAPGCPTAGSFPPRKHLQPALSRAQSSLWRAHPVCTQPPALPHGSVVCIVCPFPRVAWVPAGVMGGGWCGSGVMGGDCCCSRSFGLGYLHPLAHLLQHAGGALSNGLPPNHCTHT